MKIQTISPCPSCGGFRFENGDARHADWCPIPDLDDDAKRLLLMEQLRFEVGPNEMFPMTFGYRVLEFRMEGNVRVIDKLDLHHVSVDPLIL